MADVLILVKHAPTRKKLASLFETDRLQVLTTSSPELGRALLHNAHFDLIIADTAIAGPGGVEIIAEARRSQPDAGIIAVSGSALTRSPTFKEYVHQLRAEHHFTLPFESKAILLAAHNMLAAQRNRTRTGVDRLSAHENTAPPMAASH